MTIRNTIAAGVLSALFGISGLVTGGAANANDADVNDNAGFDAVVVNQAPQADLSDADVIEIEVHDVLTEVATGNTLDEAEFE